MDFFFQSALPQRSSQEDYSWLKWLNSYTVLNENKKYTKYSTDKYGSKEVILNFQN